MGKLCTHKWLLDTSHLCRNIGRINGSLIISGCLNRNFQILLALAKLLWWQAAWTSMSFLVVRLSQKVNMTRKNICHELSLEDKVSRHHNSSSWGQTARSCLAVQCVQVPGLTFAEEESWNLQGLQGMPDKSAKKPRTDVEKGEMLKMNNIILKKEYGEKGDADTSGAITRLRSG